MYKIAYSSIMIAPHAPDWVCLPLIEVSNIWTDFCSRFLCCLEHLVQQRSKFSIEQIRNTKRSWGCSEFWLLQNMCTSCVKVLESSYMVTQSFVLLWLDIGNGKQVVKSQIENHEFCFTWSTFLWSPPTATSRYNASLCLCWSSSGLISFSSPSI